MKLLSIFFIFLFFCSLELHAYSCPQNIDADSETSSIYKLLAKLKEQKYIQDCEVHVHMCDKSRADYEANNPLAEIVVVNGSGREGYIQLTLDQENKDVRYKMNKTRKSFVYEKWDTAFESREGKLQKYRLHLYKKTAGSEYIDILDLGIFSSNRKLDQDNGNDSRWFVCRP